MINPEDIKDFDENRDPFDDPCESTHVLPDWFLFLTLLALIAVTVIL